MLRIGTDGLILFMEPTSFGTLCNKDILYYLIYIYIYIYSSLVNNSFSKTFARYRAILWRSTVAFFFVLLSAFLFFLPFDNLFVVRSDDGLYIGHAAITIFYVVSVETVTLHDNHTEETYVGLSENTFKTRYNGHNSTFRNANQRYSTTLSSYVWILKDSDIPHTIHWKIIAKCKPYSNNTRRCNLCLHEKFLIICRPDMSSLNKRNELIGTCRHSKKFLLCNAT